MSRDAHLVAKLRAEAKNFDGWDGYPEIAALMRDAADALAPKIMDYKPLPLPPEGTLTVRGLGYFNGTTLVATDQGLFRVEGETLVKVEPAPPSDRVTG